MPSTNPVTHTRQRHAARKAPAARVGHMAACLLSCLPLTLLGLPAHAYTFTTLYTFTRGSDGGQPEGGLVQDAAGVLYGDTSSAGAAQCTPTPGKTVKGCGTVYSFSQAAGLKTIVTFTGPNGAIGSSTLLLRGNTLYGNTVKGGVNGAGVVFSVHTDGTGFTLLHQFNGTDGSGPVGSMQMGPGGVLYGITSAGGLKNQGVLYKLAPSGQYGILHTFTGGIDGADPTELVIAPSGALTGGTYFGGFADPNAPEGYGVVFAYLPAAGRFSILHSFNGTDGSSPYIGSVGTGRTVYGNGSLVFSISRGAGFADVASSNEGTGYPHSGPTLVSDGSLIGTNSIGPEAGGGFGVLYSAKNGVFTSLYIFGSISDGSNPWGQPLVTPSGTIFGTTEGGGAGCKGQCGTIWQYTP